MSKVHLMARKSAPPETDALALRRAEGLAKIGNFIARLQDAGFFGKVTISLQNGVFAEARIEQVLKDDEI